MLPPPALQSLHSIPLVVMCFPSTEHTDGTFSTSAVDFSYYLAHADCTIVMMVMLPFEPLSVELSH